MSYRPIIFSMKKSSAYGRKYAQVPPDIELLAAITFCLTAPARNPYAKLFANSQEEEPAVALSHGCNSAAFHSRNNLKKKDGIMKNQTSIKKKAQLQKTDHAVVRTNRVMLLCFALFLALCAGCGEKEPLKIGFAGPLSGTLSDFGLSNHRGVVLALEEINATGGIQGRQLQLLIKDDHNDPEVAAQVDRELINEGVVTILGHFTSTATLAVIPLMNEQNMLLLSSGASSEELTGQDDFFLRVLNSHGDFATALAQYAYTVAGLRRTAVVYDLANPAYSEDYYNAYQKNFETLGGAICRLIPFDSRTGIDVVVLVETIISNPCDSLLMIAGALDAAALRQQLHKQGVAFPVMSSSWAMRQEFIENGGAAVEGTIFVSSIGINDSAPRLDEFKQKFAERFGAEADLSAIFGYDAMTALAQGLRQVKNFTPAEIKDAILAESFIHGLHEDFAFDQYGDVHRKAAFFILKNGEFTVMNPQ